MKAERKFEQKFKLFYPKREEKHKKILLYVYPPLIIFVQDLNHINLFSIENSNNAIKIYDFCLNVN